MSVSFDDKRLQAIELLKRADYPIEQEEWVEEYIKSMQTELEHSTTGFFGILPSSSMEQIQIREKYQEESRKRQAVLLSETKFSEIPGSDKLSPIIQKSFIEKLQSSIIRTLRPTRSGFPSKVLDDEIEEIFLEIEAKIAAEEIALEISSEKTKNIHRESEIYLHVEQLVKRSDKEFEKKFSMQFEAELNGLGLKEIQIPLFVKFKQDNRNLYLLEKGLAVSLNNTLDGDSLETDEEEYFESDDISLQSVEDKEKAHAMIEELKKSISKTKFRLLIDKNFEEDKVFNTLPASLQEYFKQSLAEIHESIGDLTRNVRETLESEEASLLNKEIKIAESLLEIENFKDLSLEKQKEYVRKILEESMVISAEIESGARDADKIANAHKNIDHIIKDIASFLKDEAEEFKEELAPKEAGKQEDEKSWLSMGHDWMVQNGWYQKLLFGGAAAAATYFSGIFPASIALPAAAAVGVVTAAGTTPESYDKAKAAILGVLGVISYPFLEIADICNLEQGLKLDKGFRGAMVTAAVVLSSILFATALTTTPVGWVVLGVWAAASAVAFISKRISRFISKVKDKTEDPAHYAISPQAKEILDRPKIKEFLDLKKDRGSEPSETVQKYFTHRIEELRDTLKRSDPTSKEFGIVKQQLGAAELTLSEIQHIDISARSTDPSKESTKKAVSDLKHSAFETFKCKAEKFEDDIFTEIQKDEEKIVQGFVNIVSSKTSDPSPVKLSFLHSTAERLKLSPTLSGDRKQIKEAKEAHKIGRALAEDLEVRQKAQKVQSPSQ